MEEITSPTANEMTTLKFAFDVGAKAMPRATVWQQSFS